MNNQEKNKGYTFNENFLKTMDTVEKEDYSKTQKELEKATEYTMKFFRKDKEVVV